MKETKQLFTEYRKKTIIKMYSLSVVYCLLAAVVCVAESASRTNESSVEDLSSTPGTNLSTEFETALSANPVQSNETAVQTLEINGTAVAAVDNVDKSSNGTAAAAEEDQNSNSTESGSKAKLGCHWPKYVHHVYHEPPRPVPVPVQPVQRIPIPIPFPIRYPYPVKFPVQVPVNVPMPYPIPYPMPCSNPPCPPRQTNNYNYNYNYKYPSGYGSKGSSGGSGEGNGGGVNYAFKPQRGPYLWPSNNYNTKRTGNGNSNGPSVQEAQPYT